MDDANKLLTPHAPHNYLQDDNVVDSVSALLSLLRGTTISINEPGHVCYAAPLNDMQDVYCVEEALKHSIFVHTLRVQGCQ